MIAVTDKEMEALLFVMDDTPLVSLLMRRRGVAVPDVSRAIRKLRPLLEARMLPRSMNPVERVLIASAIEDSDWPQAYADFHPEELDEAHTVLRGLAHKVERLGVEVDRIARA